MKKCLIAIDGIDGSGKETQTKLLLSSLESDGIQTYTMNDIMLMIKP